MHSTWPCAPYNRVFHPQLLLVVFWQPLLLVSSFLGMLSSLKGLLDKVSPTNMRGKIQYELTKVNLLVYGH